MMSSKAAAAAIRAPLGIFKGILYPLIYLFTYIYLHIIHTYYLYLYIYTPQNIDIDGELCVEANAI